MTVPNVTDAPAAPSQVLRVAIVDDDPFVLTALRAYLSQQAQYDAVVDRIKEASDTSTTLENELAQWKDDTYVRSQVRERLGYVMPGDTTEFAAMSDDRCKFCKSTIDDANDIHSKGGWADKWDQEIVSMTYYEKLEGYEYNRVKVIVNYGAMASYYGDGQNPTTSEPSEGKVLNVAVRYSNKRWMIGTVEVEHK